MLKKFFFEFHYFKCRNNCFSRSRFSTCEQIAFIHIFQYLEIYVFLDFCLFDLCFNSILFLLFCFQLLFSISKNHSCIMDTIQTAEAQIQQPTATSTMTSMFDPPAKKSLSVTTMNPVVLTNPVSMDPINPTLLESIPTAVAVPASTTTTTTTTTTTGATSTSTSTHHPIAVAIANDDPPNANAVVAIPLEITENPGPEWNDVQNHLDLMDNWQSIDAHARNKKRLKTASAALQALSSNKQTVQCDTCSTKFRGYCQTCEQPFHKHLFFGDTSITQYGTVIGCRHFINQTVSHEQAPRCTKCIFPCIQNQQRQRLNVFHLYDKFIVPALIWTWHNDFDHATGQIKTSSMSTSSITLPSNDASTDDTADIISNPWINYSLFELDDGERNLNRYGARLISQMNQHVEYRVTTLNVSTSSSTSASTSSTSASTSSHQQTKFLVPKQKFRQYCQTLLNSWCSNALAAHEQQKQTYGQPHQHQPLAKTMLELTIQKLIRHTADLAANFCAANAHHLMLEKRKRFYLKPTEDFSQIHLIQKSICALIEHFLMYFKRIQINDKTKKKQTSHFLDRPPKIRQNRPLTDRKRKEIEIYEETQKALAENAKPFMAGRYAPRGRNSEYNVFHEGPQNILNKKSYPISTCISIFERTNMVVTGIIINSQMEPHAPQLFDIEVKIIGIDIDADQDGTVKHKVSNDTNKLCIYVHSLFKGELIHHAKMIKQQCGESNDFRGAILAFHYRDIYVHFEQVPGGNGQQIGRQLYNATVSMLQCAFTLNLIDMYEIENDSQNHDGQNYDGQNHDSQNHDSQNHNSIKKIKMEEIKIEENPLPIASTTSSISSSSSSSDMYLEHQIDLQL